MKILAIADEECKALWDHYEPGKLDDYDLIISCGDLEPRYLSFLATFARCPVLYVHGNHDKKYKDIPPEGCICIEDQIYEYKGIRILGLGGSMQYTGAAHQYTEKQMIGRVKKLRWKLFLKKGFDILVTHAPAYQLNDGDDLPHKGFKVFKDLIERYAPKYFIHGHMHKNYRKTTDWVSSYQSTQIINAYVKHEFDYK